jgi:hypothetical protein
MSANVLKVQATILNSMAREIHWTTLLLAGCHARRSIRCRRPLVHALLLRRG